MPGPSNNKKKGKGGKGRVAGKVQNGNGKTMKPQPSAAVAPIVEPETKLETKMRQEEERVEDGWEDEDERGYYQERERERGRTRYRASDPRNAYAHAYGGPYTQSYTQSYAHRSFSCTPSPSPSPSPSLSQSPSTPPSHGISIPLDDSEWDEQKPCPKLGKEVPQTVEKVLFQPPFIHDPGNGPRVRDARAFMGSFFAQPAAVDDPLCAEFAQEEVLQMLCTVLPEETALILWYNKSRTTSRVCPACQRLYRLGDVLQDLIEEEEEEDERGGDKPISPLLLREQDLSGLCSPVCFILASFNYPGAIRSAWGRMADEMDDTAWGMLNGPGAVGNSTSKTLGMLVKMTRLHDLGLAQLCFDGEEGLFEEEEISENMGLELGMRTVSVSC